MSREKKGQGGQKQRKGKKKKREHGANTRMLCVCGGVIRFGGQERKEKKRK